MDTQSWIRSAQEDDRAANVVLMVGGGEDMLSAKSSLLFFKMSITSLILWVAVTSGCLLHFQIFTHLFVVVWLCQQGSGPHCWTNPNRNKLWKDEKNQFCKDKYAAWPLWIFSSPWKLLIFTSKYLSVTTSDSKRSNFSPLLCSCHTAVNAFLETCMILWFPVP